VQREEIFDAGSAALSKTEYAYDNAPMPDRGDLTSVVVWKDSTNFFTREWNAYDAYGNRTSATDALSRTTTIQYDSVYNVFPASVTNALNHTTTTTYDYRFGKPARVIDPNNAATSYQYDAFGRTEKIWLPLEHTANPDTKYDPTVRYTYTLGNPRSTAKVEVRNDLGGANAATYQPAWWFFDGLGRTIQQQTQSATSGQTIFANTAYTARGEVWRVSNPYTLTVASGAYQNPDWTKPSTTHDYDPIGRAIKTTNPDATFQTIAYNQWTTTFTDANGHKRETVADAFGRITQVKEYTGAQTYQLYATTNYQYDTLNRLRFVTDAATNQTEMRYDWLGRKTWMSDPDLGTWNYRYDNVGNLTKQTDAKSQGTCFYYDQLNRVLGKTYHSNATNIDASFCAESYAVSYSYDNTTNNNKGKGRRTGMGDGSGSTSWVYDLQGRTKSQTNTINGAPSSYLTQWTYDAMDRVRTMTYPDGEQVATTYNNQGLPATSSGYVTNALYNAAGQLTQIDLNNTVRTTYTYHAQNARLMQLQTVGASVLQNLAYEYDPVGNVKKITDAVRNNEASNYEYDDLDR
jgi:YD repeat-containing protein